MSLVLTKNFCLASTHEECVYSFEHFWEEVDKWEREEGMSIVEEEEETMDQKDIHVEDDMDVEEMEVEQLITRLNTLQELLKQL